MNRKAAQAAKTSGVVEPNDLVKELSAHVVDAALEVHRNLGPGFLQAVYEEALAVDLHLREIAIRPPSSHRSEPERTSAARCTRPRRPTSERLARGRALREVNHKGFSVGDSHLDLLVDKRLVVELKAIEHIAPVHVAQVLSYLKDSRLTLALLITFNVRTLRQGIRRVILGR